MKLISNFVINLLPINPKRQVVIKTNNNIPIINIITKKKKGIGFSGKRLILNDKEVMITVDMTKSVKYCGIEIFLPHIYYFL